MSIFCDFLHMSQTFSKKVPFKSFSDGLIVRLDGAGEVVFQSEAFKEVEGSFDTKLRIRMFDNRLELRGNVGRFGRSDNVFGIPFSQCVARANEILRGEFGLPEFTPGEPFVHSSKGNAPPKLVYTGARVSRIDMTRNYATGSEQAAGDAIMHFGGIQPTRAMSHAYGKETITYGEGSTYTYAKLYDKYREMLRHKSGSPELLEWVREQGLIRYELEMKYAFLERHGINFLGGLMGTTEVHGDSVEYLPDGKIRDGLLTNQFRKYSRFLSEAKMHIDEKLDLPGHLAGTYLMWRDGYDLRARLPKATFYKHRKALRAYGVDIAIAHNVQRLPVKFRVVSLTPAERPDWYALPLAA
jgi:hypothetical protein